MSNLLKILFCLFALALALIVRVQLDDFFMNTVYTVLGIMFSVGIGIIVTFNLQGIRDPKIIQEIRSNLKKVRNKYISHFVLSSFLFTIDKYLRELSLSVLEQDVKGVSIHLNVSLLFCLIMFFSTAYFILNFLALQKLSEDIFDRTS